MSGGEKQEGRSIRNVRPKQTENNNLEDNSDSPEDAMLAANTAAWQEGFSGLANKFAAQGTRAASGHESGDTTRT